MFTKLLFKRILPTLVALALLTLGGLWLYGYFGVKQGWIGVADYPGLKVGLVRTLRISSNPLPHDDHDVPMDVLVSDGSVWMCNRKAAE